MRFKMFSLFFIIVFAIGLLITPHIHADEGCSSGKTDSGCSSLKAGDEEGCPMSKGAICTKTTSSHSCSGDCGDKLCSSKMGEIKEKHPEWILSSANELYFSEPLIAFLKIEGRYPRDVEELIDSGLLLTWPANPDTGKPLQLVSSVKADRSDMNKIAYVRKSDSEAYFEIVIESEAKPVVYKFPCCKTVDGEMQGCEGKAKYPSQVKKEIFERCINGVFNAAMSRDDLKSGKFYPTSPADLLNGNCYLIKENLNPDFISGEPGKAVYIEKGIAKMGDIPVKFEKSTICFLDENGKEFNDSLFWIAPLQESDDSWVEDDTAWNKLSDKIYCYSTKMAKNGGMNLPDSVLISKATILN